MERQLPRQLERVLDPLSQLLLGNVGRERHTTHFRYARFVTAPDAIAQGGACEQNLVNWFRTATLTLHVIPVIAVWNVTEGGCVNHGIPSTASYTTDVAQLVDYLDALGDGPVQYIEAWNEPNSSGVSAPQAAAYWRAANTVCATDQCTAIAGDFVDNDPDQGSQSFAPGCVAGLTFNSHLKPFEVSYVKALGAARAGDLGIPPVLRRQLRTVRVRVDVREQPAEAGWAGLVHRGRRMGVPPRPVIPAGTCAAAE